MHVDAGGSLFLGAFGLRQRLLGQDQVVLPVGDLGLDAGAVFVGAVVAEHQVGDQCLGVLLVEDREAGFVAQALVLLADDVQAQIVKGGDGQPAGFVAADQLAHAFFHLARGFIGKGDSHNVLGLDAAFLHQVGDFARDHAGFAASSTGQHQQWATDVIDGLLLTGVEPCHGVNIS